MGKERKVEKGEDCTMVGAMVGLRGLQLLS